MVFHSLVSARLMPPLNKTPAQLRPANGCIQPTFLGLLVDLPGEEAFSHRGVRYGGSPTIFIVSSKKPDPPYASLFVTLKQDPDPLLFVHLFPPIPLSSAVLSQPIEPLHVIESSTIEVIIHLFFTLLRDTILGLARSSYALPIQPTWLSYPRYDMPQFYSVEITGSLPSDNPPYYVVWDSLCFINSIREELICGDFYGSPTERVPLSKSADWLRRTRSQPKAAWVPPPNPTPPTPCNPIMVDLARVQNLPLSDEVWFRPRSPEGFESYKSIPPPNIQSSPSFDLIVLDITGLIQDRMGALQSYLGVCHAQRLLELENMEFAATGGSYAEILARSLKRLATEMPTIRVDDDELFQRLLEVRADLDSQFQVLLQSGIPIIGYSTIDGVSLISVGFKPPSWISWMYVPDDAAGLYRPCTQHLTAVLEHARVHFPNADPSRILVVSTSLLRCLAPATETGMATVIPDLPQDFEIQALHEVSKTRRNTPVAWTQRIQPLTHLLTVNSMQGEPFHLELIQHVYAVLECYNCFPNELDETSVNLTLNVLNNHRVIIKYSVNAEQNIVVEREALVYRQLAGCPFIPRVMSIGPLQGICLEYLGPTLDHLRRLCRGRFSHRTLLMIAIRLLSFLKFAHSAGIIMQDMTPGNLAVGLDDPTRIYAFDFANCHAYLDPEDGRHICYNRVKSHTTRYLCSHWAHYNIEITRRDDIAMLGHTLLYLYHGRLPWEHLSAPNYDAYFEQVAHMKTLGHAELQIWLQNSPPLIANILSRAHGLAYEQEPDYDGMLQRLQLELSANGWLDDGQFDWVAPELAPLGTLLPEEFKFVSKSFGGLYPLLGYS